MTTIKATIKGRRLELDAPADWPDGTEVAISPLAEANGSTDTMSSADIAATLAAMDQIVPFELSDTEEAAWNTERNARKAQEKARFSDHADELRRNWE